MKKANRCVRLSAMLVGIVALTGCSGAFSKYAVRPSVEPTSTVQINTTFDIPNQKARVYFQSGEQVRWGEIDRWTAHCSVLVNNVQYADQPQQTVLPGRFDILKVRESNDLRYASRVFVASRDGFFYDPPSNVIYQVEMRLESAEQPDVRALICAKRVDDYGHHYPTLAEIRTALGDLIVIEQQAL